MTVLLFLLLAADEPFSLRAHLLNECQKHFDARRAAVARLKTPEQIAERQKALRAQFVVALGGFPERTPLKARTVGRIAGDGYTIERVIYESRPDHHVTASLYLPAGKGPFPGVLMPIGHSDTGKAADYVQRGCILLARNGMAALAYDPIGQGERRQLLDDKGVPAIRGSTAEHTLIGVGAILVGSSTATYRIWDGIRSLDYLASRPEIDAKRLGCTGCSGGGTLTSYLMALDERVAAAAPSCYITSLERLFATIGPQDAEQNVTGQVALGLEHADYVTLRAPRPTLICAATGDFFDIKGTWDSFREAKRVYTMLGHPERVDILESDTKHGYPRSHREGAVRWMRRWLLGKDDLIAETDGPLRTVEELRCTRTGQVLDDLKGVSCFGLNARRATEFAKVRPPVTAEIVAKTLGLTLPVEKEPGVVVRTKMVDGKGPLLVVVPDAGLDAGEKVMPGRRRLIVEPRGFGSKGAGSFGNDFRESFLALHLARPLLAQRVQDVLGVIGTLKEDVELVGVGKGAVVALHAAALSPRVTRVRLEGMLASWEMVTKTPQALDQLTQVVPGVLARYDLPELAESLKPRGVEIVKPVNAVGDTISAEEAKRLYGVEVGGGSVLADMQLVMGDLPPTSRKVPLDVKVEGTETLSGVVRKKITFAVEKGDRVSAYLLVPTTAKRMPAVLCLHQTTAIGKGEPAGVGGNADLHYALELARRGYVTLAPDYPNFGGYKLDVYARGYASATMKGVWNHMRAVDLLASLPEVDANNIGVVGHSLGGHNALFVAAFDLRLKAVVTSCGFNSFRHYRKGRLSDWSHKGYMPRIKDLYGDDATKMPFDFPDVLAAIAPRPVFANAPVKDNDFEVEGVRACAAAKNLEVVYPDAGHTFPRVVRHRAYSFLDRHLKPTVTRLVAHWAEYADDDYLRFVEDARPDVCQVGFYGGHFYSLAHTPQFSGYPAHFPVRGLAEGGRWLERRNADIHARGSKVVGHFNVTFLVGEPDGPQGFFKFYRDLWDEKELGPKPVADGRDLIARRADGSLMASKSYSIGGMREYTACLNNPHWRAVLKAWAKRGIERGVDGYMINYFYRHDCVCEHCQKKFRTHLAGRFSPAELETLGIKDVRSHTFPEIVGWHDPKTSTPLRREMLRWSQLCCKEAFDEVFVTYAKGLKPNLLVGQWNHLGDFAQVSGDERSLLPDEVWGRGEDYLWYSTGGAANFTDLGAGFLGDATLQARYIRGAFRNKPFTLGKYESTRIRAAIAELAANGGAPMGFYTRFKDPAARDEIVRYYRFLAERDEVYRGAESHAEVALLFPRSRVHAGDVAAVEAFKRVGRNLLERHVLFDVIPDDRLPTGYRAVLDHTGGDVPKGVSTFTAPKTVRVSAGRPVSGDELAIHFVNYDREEPKTPRSPGGGIKDEKPTAVEGVKADLVVKGKVTAVTVSTPEGGDTAVPFEQAGERVRFAVPRFLVYAVARLRLR